MDQIIQTDLSREMEKKELEELISTWSGEVEKLNAQYTRVKKETFSFDKRREIRGKIRDFTAKIDSLTRLLAQLRF